MAKKAKATKARTTEAVKSSEVTTLTNERKLRSLLASDDAYKGKIDGIVGTLREEIKNAVDKHHLNKKAYAMLKTLHRMKDEQLADLWPTLLVYMDMAGVTKRIESIERLPLDAPEEPEAEDESHSGEASGARETSEAAGEAFH